MITLDDLNRAEAAARMADSVTERTERDIARISQNRKDQSASLVEAIKKLTGSYYQSDALSARGSELLMNQLAEIKHDALRAVEMALLAEARQSKNKARLIRMSIRNYLSEGGENEQV